MHFLGFMGMPRRIPDYPDVYAHWNHIASFGSSISVLAFICLVALIYDLGVSQNKLLRKSSWVKKSFTYTPKSFKHGSSIVDNYFGQKQIWFHSPATSNMERIIDLHHDIFFFLIILSFIVLWAIIRIHWLFIRPESAAFYKPKYKKPSKVTHNTVLEIMWTIIPCILLVIIAIPSITLIYSFQPLNSSNLVFKITGNQWWWAYEYENKDTNKALNYLDGINLKILQKSEFSKSDNAANFIINNLLDVKKNYLNNVETKLIECRLIDELDLEKGNFRLLETSSKIQMPRNIQITVLVTSNDVLHSWTVPALGVKIDACPGRLNEIEFLIYKEGIFFGQCSEICGFYHGFMPIVIECKSFFNIFKPKVIVPTTNLINSITKDWLADF